jgi:hypothetical protein
MHFALIPGLGTVGPTELIMLLTIILLLFGVQRIPELAKGVGSGPARTEIYGPTVLPV